MSREKISGWFILEKSMTFSEAEFDGGLVLIKIKVVWIRFVLKVLKKHNPFHCIYGSREVFIYGTELCKGLSALRHVETISESS